MLLGEWLDRWLALYIDSAVSRLAPNTRACYHRAVRAVPARLRAVPLDQLTALDILPWLLEVAEEHPRAAQLDRVMLSKALRTAAKVGLCAGGIIDNDTCPAPVYAPSEAIVMDIGQLRRYMATARASECAPILMLCACGLRRGEAMGVQWSAVDLHAGVLSVVGQRSRDTLLPLKTQASRRRLKLPPVVLQVLRTWPRSIAHDWVCDAPQKRVYAEHRKVLAVADLPAGVTLHGLRHSYATAAAEMGIPIKALQGALGHAHFAVTADVYADHFPDVSGVAADVFDTAHDWKSCYGLYPY